MYTQNVNEINADTSMKDEVDSKTFTMATFHEKSHFWGRLTIWSVIVLTVFLPAYLSFGLGYHPGWQIILSGLAAYAGVIAVVWALEPIMYFPMLGVSGTYISFLTGNISNMCLPSAAAAQSAVGAEPGTAKGEITATLSISAASLVNKLLLIPIIIGGAIIVANMPPQIEAVFPLVLPAIFGAVFAQFAMKKPIYGAIALIIGICVNLIALPIYLKSLTCIVLTVLICIQLERMKEKKLSKS